METRGRGKNNDKIKQAHELKALGLTSKDISETMGISEAMARYYLRQEVTEKPKRESLGTCFFRQPIEVQKRIAEEIGYILPSSSDTEEVYDTYKKVENAVRQEEISENGLLSKCTKFLNRKIALNEIEEVFTNDEMKLLSGSSIFMSKAKEIFGAEKSIYSVDEVIEELKNKGIK